MCKVWASVRAESVRFFSYSGTVKRVSHAANSVQQ